MVKKLITLVLCALMAFSLAACGENKTDTDSPTIPADEDTNIGEQMANPFVDCESLKDAASLAGFDISVPENIDGYEDCFTQAIKNEMIQVIYSQDENTIFVRKSVGEEDNSGDYNSYEAEKEIDINGKNVTMKLNGDAAYLAVWLIGGFSYSVNISSGATIESLTELVRVIQ